jgi:DNA-binding transcriptional LysR family regulator
MMMLNKINLSRIDLNLLVVFSVVLDERHVGHAAARLNLTPSAVSHAIGRLRSMLNDPLFLRTPKGVVPTARALELGPPTADILSRVGRVIAQSGPFDPANYRRRFVVGGPDAIMTSLAQPVLNAVSELAPGVDISMLHLMPTTRGVSLAQPWLESLEKLETGEMDIAVLPVGSVPPRFESRFLYHEDFVVAMRKGHPFNKSPTQTQYLKASHLLVSESGDPRGFVDDQLAKRGQKRRIALTVPNFMMALAHLAESDMVAALPRRLVSQEAGRFGLVWKELPFRRKPDPIRLVTTKAAMQDEGISWFMQVLESIFAEGRPTLANNVKVKEL